MSTQVLSKEVPIEEFVAGLRRFAEPAFGHVDQILGFVKSTPVAPDTLRPYLTWDRQHYTRNLIDKTPLYELVAIFRVLAQDLDAGKCRLEPSDTCEMNSAHPCAVDPLEPVHRVLNPRDFNERAVSLHVYSHPFNTCVVYSPEQGTCGVIQLHYNTEYGRPVKL